MKTLEVDLGNRSYPIYIGADLIDRPELFKACEKSSSIYIVTNTTVAPLYAERLTKTLGTFGKTVRTIVLPDGESYKDWKNLQLIFDDLLKFGADRQTMLHTIAKNRTDGPPSPRGSCRPSDSGPSAG